MSVALTLVFSSCDLTEPDDYAATHLADYGIPSFDKAKFRSVERLYRDYFVTELPDSDEMAATVAALYFTNYDGKIDTDDTVAVTDALINCYVYATGDKFSIYRTAVANEEYTSTMSGNYCGIGVTVRYDPDDKTLVITEVFKDSPAGEVGMLAGDFITAVGDELVSDLGYDATLTKVKGDEGTTVLITILRGDEVIPLTVTRREFVVKSVEYSINEDNIGYIKISSFKSNTASQFYEAYEFMRDAGAVGIIYDLRGNTGGYLHSVVDILTTIAPKGTTIVSFSNGYSDPVTDTDSIEFLLPSVVLCNGRTASAGELFTSAMRDFDEIYGHLEVTLVGKTTYGKGIMQRPYELGDGSTITMTIAYYNPPSGVNYNGVGITPDVIAEEEDQLGAAYAEIYKLVK